MLNGFATALDHHRSLNHHALIQGCGKRPNHKDGKNHHDHFARLAFDLRFFDADRFHALFSQVLRDVRVE